jgi:hypothetical protein
LKTTDSHTSTHTATPEKAVGTFFKKNGEQSFFGPSPTGNTFFSGASQTPSATLTSGTIQPKLTVGAPDDVYEKEADKMADQVVQRKPIFESNAEPPEQSAPEAPTIRRKPIQDQAAPQQVETNLTSSKGSGSPLPKDTRTEMESSFGKDFSDVKIHKGPQDAAMNKELNAQAFTHGKDIYFNDGKYDPNTTPGKHLLAHELTHVTQQSGDTVTRSPGTVAQPPVSTVSPKVQRSVVDDVASHLLTGNDLLDFMVGVIAGIVEWFGDLIVGIGTLLKAALWDNDIVANILLLGIVIIIGLTVAFPEVMLPILIAAGILIGFLAMSYFLYMMFRPGLTPYERGKYLGKAIVEAVFLAISVLEALRTLKVVGEVTKLTTGVGWVKRVIMARRLMALGDTVKVLAVLVEIGDIEKTITFLEEAKDVEKAAKVLQLAGGAGKVDDIIALLKSSRVTVDDLLDLLNIKGVTIEDIKDLLKFPITAADLKDLLGRPGMTAAELKDLLGRPGMTVADLKDLLGRPGMTIADLKDLLGRPGMTIADLKDLVGRPGMTIGDLKDFLGRPGMTVADLKDALGRPGMTVADLKDLLNIADDQAQLRRLLDLVPSINDLKNFFKLAGGPGQGAKLEAVLQKAAALGDAGKAEDLLKIAGGNGGKFAELVEALNKFRRTPAPGGTPVDLHGYSAADLAFMQRRHTYEFFNFAQIKSDNTLWQFGTDVATKLEEALTVLDRKVPPIRISPFQNPPVQEFLADGTKFEIGTNNSNIIRHFHAFENRAAGIINFSRQEMMAFKKLLVP